MLAKITTPASDELQSQTHLVRTIEAALKVAVPDSDEIRFRGTLLRCAISKISTLKPAFLIRLYEASCDVKFPSDEVTEFRHKLQFQLGIFLELKQYKARR